MASGADAGFLIGGSTSGDLEIYPINIGPCDRQGGTQSPKSVENTVKKGNFSRKGRGPVSGRP